MIKAPDLTANTQIAADFEILDKNPTGRREGEVKRFEYALRPKRAGVGIPPVVISVFNPDTEEFSETATKPIALDVSAGARVAAGEIVGAPAGSVAPEIKSREQGIFQNVTDLRELEDQRASALALAEATAGVWCGVGCLIAFVSVRRRKSGDVLWQRKRHARAARGKLAEARKLLGAGRSAEALRAIRSALVGLIADMGNIVAEGLTASEADAILAGPSIPAAERSEVMRLLEAIESAEYGSGSAADAGALLENAEKLVPSLARNLERGERCRESYRR